MTSVLALTGPALSFAKLENVFTTSRRCQNKKGLAGGFQLRRGSMGLASMPEVNAASGRLTQSSRRQCKISAEVSEDYAERCSQQEQPSTSFGAPTHVGEGEGGSPFILYSSIAPILFALAAAEGPGYSQASYYTSLGLFILSVPGVWSLIKRSAKSKIVKKTFEAPGPAAPNAKPLSQLAGEVTSFFTRNNYTISDRGEVVTFQGVLTPNRSQAAFLVFCTFLSLASVALVLTITVPDVGENWYWLTLLSPLSGAYYWKKASRKEEIKVKMVVSDDENTVDVVVQGDDEEINRLRTELKLMEKGMVYVKGIFEM
eukprot:jgi/Mesen1/5450/ME000273S04691